MPGVASLEAGQYYAHPRNSFWKIMSELVQFDPDLAYEMRVLALKSAGIAVWDVIDSCFRKGSSDAMIKKSDLVVNDFREFFQTHRAIRQVFFNGGQAEACYKHYVLPQLDSESIVYRRLPSTSPANASMAYAQKLSDWRVITDPPILKKSVE